MTIAKEKRKDTGKVKLSDLLGSIKSTRNLNDIKKKLSFGKKSSRGARKENSEQKEYSQKSKLSEDLYKKNNARKVMEKQGTLDAPLHRQAKDRVESEIAYAESRKELHKWNSIVVCNREAEQIHFPMDDSKDRVLCAADKAKTLEPKNELEKQMSEVLGKSKYNLRNKDGYCEAEKEILKAMSLKEAKRKCAELQKTRALMSYKAAKLKQQSKIKSKQFHRVRKREQRREMIKDIESLIERNPEEAKEKLLELDKDRAYERATLKHRGIGKWSKHIRQFASKNPELRNLLDDQLRLGRELKDKRDSEQAADIIEEIWPRIEEEKRAEDAQAISVSLYEPDEIHHEELRLDDANVLKLKPREIIRIPIELMDNKSAELPQDIQESFLAEAYEDDDVLLEFQVKKQKIEEEERPKDIDRTLHGWGSWTGPGIVTKIKNDKFVEKPTSLVRKDANRPGVIIREKISKGIQDLQPRDVPFPYTSIRDYETVVQQPLGRDWNTPMAQAAIIQSTVVTKAGRIIRPMNKTARLKMDEDTSESDTE